MLNETLPNEKELLELIVEGDESAFAKFFAHYADRIFSLLGKNRCYIIAPAHMIQNDVCPERVEKFIELCLMHGKY